VEGLFEARALPSPRVTSVGFGARASRSGPGLLGFRIDLLADYGQRSTAIGTVSVDTVSVGPSLFVQARRGLFALEGGAGLRVGLADLTGHPNASSQERGGSLLSAWGGPVVNVDAYAELIHGVALALGGELGDAPFPVRGLVVGPSGGDVSIVGVWFGAHVGVAGLF
jgi:hypothetical protein